MADARGPRGTPWCVDEKRPERGGNPNRKKGFIPRLSTIPVPWHCPSGRRVQRAIAPRPPNCPVCADDWTGRDGSPHTHGTARGVHDASHDMSTSRRTVQNARTNQSHIPWRLASPYCTEQRSRRAAAAAAKTTAASAAALAAPPRLATSGFRHARPVPTQRPPWSVRCARLRRRA